jgi:hypothetical protein
MDTSEMPSISDCFSVTYSSLAGSIIARAVT